MIRRALAALLMLPTSPAVPQTTVPAPAIPRILCPQPDGGGYAGSAFRIGPHLLVSVKHVTDLPHCGIDGVPLHILWTSPTADISILRDERAGKWLKLDCNGFVAGRKYLAVGHPRASVDLVIVPMIATGHSEGGEALLVGMFTAQPGHSGGAIIDAETHAVVGTINTGDWEDGITGSVELKGTPVCQQNIA